jgi:hypothetical protein
MVARRRWVERERAAREENCQRMAQRLRRTNRKALREQRRQDRKLAADLALRRERFRAGGPFWTMGEALIILPRKAGCKSCGD